MLQDVARIARSNRGLYGGRVTFDTQTLDVIALTDIQH